jgi:hypothetical protein
VAGPDHRIPRYSPRENWEPDADDLARAGRSPDDVALRALSVAPFVLVAALGVIALVGWTVVIVFGVSAPGSSGGEPIWRWAQDQGMGEIVAQVALAVAVGLIPAAVVLVGGWATVHGFRQRPNPLFWPAAELFWGIVAVTLVVADRTRSEMLADAGISAVDWWFAFLTVAAAMVLAGVRLRRLRRARQSESGEGDA